MMRLFLGGGNLVCARKMVALEAKSRFASGNDTKGARGGLGLT
jgi:hypothetical protein